MKRNEKQKVCNKLDKEFAYHWDLARQHHGGGYERSEQLER